MENKANNHELTKNETKKFPWQVFLILFALVAIIVGFVLIKSCSTI